MTEAFPHTMADARLRVRLAHEHAILPSRAHDDDAGLDVASVEHVVLQPGDRATVGTGIEVAVPPGFAALVCPRSGLASRHGISVVNGPGVIDAGYRGEVRVVLHNTDLQSPFTIHPGDRIAQLVLVPVLTGAIEQVDELPGAPTRSVAGFGSTGGFGAVD